jgi:hypothetical protein
LATPVSPPYNTDCIAFLEGLILPVACRADTLLLWGRERHKQFMIRDARYPFSNIDALVEADLAIEVETPGPWTVVQGWRGNGTGHAFAIVRCSDNHCLILEASKALLGVGWRGIGNIRARGCKIPTDWQSRSPTWERVKSDFSKVRMAQLLVEV